MTRILLPLLLLLLAQPVSATQKNTSPVRHKPVTWVDTSLRGSQKFTLVVDGKPFYPLSIQIRADVMRHALRWSAKAIEASFATAKEDGFNMVGIPVHWAEIEGEKDHFDWTVIDQYLTFASRHGLKMEMLWFGANSGGTVQWLAPQWAWQEMGGTNPSDNHLRVPDYVLYTPAFGSSDGSGCQQTTSQYTIAREKSNYTLDMGDTRLRDRETYVLSRLMQHIAEWDQQNGAPHTLVGVQIDNEVAGFNVPSFDNELIIDYLSHVASAVKESAYPVWTRVNCVLWNDRPRLLQNELLRAMSGTSIDFVGLDSYRRHFDSDSQFFDRLRDDVPYLGKNYRMIMETNGGFSSSVPMAILSGNGAFSYYDFFSLYGKDSVKDTMVPVADDTVIEDMRLVNRILGSDLEDIATRAHGYDLYVHNWASSSTKSKTSPLGITFEPDYPTSHGISIRHSATQYVLMSTRGGLFTLPDGQQIRVGKGQTIRVNVAETNPQAEPYAIYQAEDAELYGEMQKAYDIRCIGFAGNGYLQLPSREGSWAKWTGIDGNNGGRHTISLRYSLELERSARVNLEVNGKPHYLVLPPTGASDHYTLFPVAVDLKPGTDNVIRLVISDNFNWEDGIHIIPHAGHLDEIQVSL